MKMSVKPPFLKTYKNCSKQCSHTFSLDSEQPAAIIEHQACYSLNMHL